jgi:TPR repeat protein
MNSLLLTSSVPVLDYYNSGPPGGYPTPSSMVRLSAEDGGVYGPGSQHQPKDVMKSDPALSEEDVFEYYRFMAEKGDLHSQWVLGRTFFEGTPTVAQNFPRALRYLSAAAKAEIPTGPDVDASSIKQRQIMSGQAAGLVGKMYLRGDGVPKDNATATRWFSGGAKLNDAHSIAWLGIMTVDKARMGSSNVQSPLTDENQLKKGMDLLRRAAKVGDADAESYLGRIYLQQGDSDAEAIQLLSKATYHGNIPAAFVLAEIHYHGRGVSPTCSTASTVLRSIVEQGIEWIFPHDSIAYNVLADPEANNMDLSLLLYLIAAESGIEIAQSNLAWLIDQRNLHYAHAHSYNGVSAPSGGADSTGQDERSGFSSLFPSWSIDIEEVALLFWSRSANQKNSDARVKVGDYYYYGRGANQSFTKAASHYEIAAQADHNPLAMWNLGYMHQHGLGVPRDFHLAKRYFDDSLVATADAWLPVSLSSFALHVHSFVFYFVDWFDQFMSSFISPSSSGTSSPPVPPSSGNSGKASEGGSALHLPQEVDILDEEWSWQDLKRVSRGPGAGAKGSVGIRKGVLSRLFSWFQSPDDDLETLLILFLCLSLSYLIYVRQLRYNQSLARGAAAPAPSPFQTAQPAQQGQSQAGAPGGSEERVPHSSNIMDQGTDREHPSALTHADTSSTTGGPRDHDSDPDSSSLLPQSSTSHDAPS